MYTRCPSCRAEISFEPPANAANLPDGYKHKIKCPSCGVTIGVKIPKVSSDIQPTFVPQNPNAVSSEATFSANLAPAEEQTVQAAMPAAKRIYGRARNGVIIAFSALVAIICALGYLAASGKLDFNGSAGLALFDGVTPIINLIDGKFSGVDAVQIVIAMLPSITMVLAVINLIVAIISCSVGKYCKPFNLISGLLIAVASVCTIFTECLLSRLTDSVSSIDFIDYLKNNIIADGKYLVFVGALFGIVIFVCSFAFLFVSNEKKPKAE